MNLELALPGIAIIGTLVAIFFAWWKPTVVQSSLREDYERLRKELECAQFGLDTAQERLAIAEKRIEELMRENIRQQAVILWQSVQFEKHKIPIDPLPDYLKEPSTFRGLNIQFHDSGVKISGNVTAQDIVGHDVTKRDETRVSGNSTAARDIPAHQEEE